MNRSLGLVLLLVLLLQACSPAEGLSPSPDPPGQDPTPFTERLAVAYLPESGDFRNPERGFHFDYDLASGTHPWLAPPNYLSSGQAAKYSDIEAAPLSLVRSSVRLDDWRQRELPSWFLDDLQGGFDQVREHGYKVILRFSYNFPTPRSPATADAPLEYVLRHIEQLQPVLRANADVILSLQAGFIGLWGEWHGSEHGLDTPENKKIIADALLAALPEIRMIQLRTPEYIMNVLENENPFPPAAAFSTTDRARLGFVNDCFLAGTNDQGTYRDEHDRTYAQALSPYTVTGGETCDSNFDRSEALQTCNNALKELALYHWDYLNLHYSVLVLGRLAEEGCFPEIATRLGYRYELLEAEVTEAVAGQWQLRLKLRNTGFGNLYNPRPLELHFRQGNETVPVRLHDDIRTIFPRAAGDGHSVVLPFTIPAGLAPGIWQLELALPDSSPTLRERPEYSIRLAGTDEETAEPLWDALTGRNRLGLRLSLPAD